ncbi:MAG TPA: hypothetical protein VKA68_12730 [bacterium]|nr:hypothetical protein [bacterium]
MGTIFLQIQRIGSPALGIILPALIFGLSVVLTYLMIRHFTRQEDSRE